MTNTAFELGSSSTNLKIDNAMKSGEIWFKGMQDIARIMVDFSQSLQKQMLQTWKDVSEVKTIADIKPAQTKIAKDFFDKSITHSAQIAASFTKTAEMTMAAAKGTATLSD